MAQLGDAVARFNNLFESPIYRDLEWANVLQEKMRTERLMESGRLVAPILRPHFLSKRQHTSLARAVQGLSSVLDRLEPDRPGQSPLDEPPPDAAGGKAACDPSCRILQVQCHSADGCTDQQRFVALRRRTGLHATRCGLCGPVSQPVPRIADYQEFLRNRYKLSKLSESNHLLAAVLKVWKEFGGPQTHRTLRWSK